MSCKPLKGVLRGESRLAGKLASSRVLGPDGLYFDGRFYGDANGYYDDNQPAPIPDGCYRNGGLVDPYYERIRDAALAEGGGLYLFQLEHGSYAGEQVIWQEMGELTPWTPGLGQPQGKTYDLMGSGEFLGQSVSMRRPVDGVWDGVNSALVASSDAVGGHLHHYKPSAVFTELSLITVPSTPTIWATKPSTGTAGGDGVLTQVRNEGVVLYKSWGVGLSQNTSFYSSGLTAGSGMHICATVSGGAPLQSKILVDGASSGEIVDTVRPDTAVQGKLTLGALPTGAGVIHAKFSHVAIYTREPTAHEISLHKRTP